MKKITPSDLRREAQAMIRDGSMPSLETLLQAVAEAREKYTQQIKASRKRVRSSDSING
jgi:vacuolar-type H+-ATPase subunit H